MVKERIGWVIIVTNRVMHRKFDGFVVSYVAYSTTGDHDGGDETALVKDGKYLILNGDHRDAYDDLGPKGWDTCVEYFHQQNDRSSWSDDV